MKSAYELALERLEEQGIGAPEELDEKTRDGIAEARRKAEAKLAELEILYKDKQGDPEAEQQYRRERQLAADERDRKIEELRKGS